jgi:rhomboid protease GluP
MPDLATLAEERLRREEERKQEARNNPDPEQ